MGLLPKTNCYPSVHREKQRHLGTVDGNFSCADYTMKESGECVQQQLGKYVCARKVSATNYF